MPDVNSAPSPRPPAWRRGLLVVVLLAPLGLGAAYGVRAWRHRPPPDPRPLPARAMPEVLRTYQGRHERDAFGSWVAGGVDLDGDGVPEVILPAPEDHVDGPGRGSVVVMSGRSGRELWRVAGDAPEVFLGERVAFGPDVDGDGVADVLIRARGIGDGADRVLVYSGRAGHLVRALTSGTRFDEIGTSMVALPDVDGDGVGDIATGASGRWDQPIAGRVHVFSGATGARLRTIAGPDRPKDKFGFSLAAVGDQDGDGIVDLAVGCLDCGAVGESTGAVYVVSLADGHVLSTLPGPARLHQFGHELAAVADADGNGRPELLVGTFLPEGLGYVRLLDPLTGHVHAELTGPETGDGFGHAVGVVGDCDGDGTPDWAIGAPDARDPATGWPGVGRVHIVSGATRATIAVVRGDLEQAHFGYETVPAGDLDGDGRADVLIGAVVGGPFTGRARVVSPTRAAAAGQTR